jgi:hypothetical protein
MPGDEPAESATAARLSTGEDQVLAADVGVEFLLVGVGVMAVVLVHPPAECQPDGQVAGDQSDQLVGAPGPEDLPMPGIVDQETHVGEDDRKVYGRGQLPPGGAQHDERRPAGDQAHGQDRDLRRVVARPPVQQARLPHLGHQIGVVTDTARSGPRDDRIESAHGSSRAIDAQASPGSGATVAATILLIMIRSIRRRAPRASDGE